MVRKEKRKRWGKMKKKHNRIGRREVRRSKVQEEESGEGRATLD